MKNKKNKIKIGQKVFIITRECNIEEKEVLAVINTKDKFGYTLDKNSCGGYTEDDIFTTKSKAQVKLQNFIDDLKFKVGDLVIFEYNEYSKKKKTIGRITKIEYFGNPYEVKSSYKEYNNISDEDILLKVKNEFIENFGNLQEFYKMFEEKEKEITDILQMIHREHDKLEKELNTSIRKQYSIFNWNKSKPKFEDRFCYERRDYYGE